MTHTIKVRRAHVFMPFHVETDHTASAVAEIQDALAGMRDIHTLYAVEDDAATLNDRLKETARLMGVLMKAICRNADEIGVGREALSEMEKTIDGYMHDTVGQIAEFSVEGA
jgi:hypothetical protein